jgi:methionyl aminopeptidase
VNTPYGHGYNYVLEVTVAGPVDLATGMVYDLAALDSAVEREVRRSGFSVIRDLGGHGIGRTIHEEPRVPNYPDMQANQILTEGLVITVEPIIAAGSGRSFVAKDKWTIVTADRKASAHYEHTLMITNGAPLLLTAA